MKAWRKIIPMPNTNPPTVDKNIKRIFFEIIKAAQPPKVIATERIKNTMERINRICCDNFNNRLLAADLSVVVIFVLLV